MNDAQKVNKRKRGVALNARGISRLQHAIRYCELLENSGKRYNTQELSERTGVSKSTISRLWKSSMGIDRRSLNQVFSAFKLELTEADIQSAYRAADETAQLLEDRRSPDQIPYPSGPVPLDSPLHIPRPPIEARACHEITQPGCILRLKAPSGFGKSSLLLRILAQAEELGFATVSLDLKQIEPAILANPEAFLRWFCSAIALKLGQDLNLEEHWNDMLGVSLSTTVFMREHILESITTPVLLSIEEFNRLFAYPATSQTFLPLLRSWYEEARHNTQWQQLRQVVSYATDSYLPLDINQSPFNVGLPLLLPEFTPEQVNTLAQLHHLHLAAADQDRLSALIGGIPALIRIAFYHLSHGDFSFDELMQSAPTSDGVFHTYLQAMLVRVKHGPEQLEQLKALVMSDQPIVIDPILAYQLEATGLVKATSEGWSISASLYRQYLRNTLFQTG